MAVIDGQRGTTDVASFQRVIDIADEIMTLEPNSTPFTLLSKKIGKQKPARDAKFSWVEDEREERFGEIDNGGGYANNATSLVVADADPFYKNSLVLVPRTNEILLVTAVTHSTKTLTVKRGYSGSSAAALNDEEVLVVLGSVEEEGGVSPASRSFNPVKVDNYTQIWKHTIDSTGTMLSSANETSPHDWRHQHRKKSVEHAIDIEYAALFGKPAEDTTTGNKPIRTTGGALHYMIYNNLNSVGALTDTVFEAWVRGMTQRGGKNKVVLSSPDLISAVNKLGVNKLEVQNEAKTYGIKVMEYVCAHGSLQFISHPELTGPFSGMGIAIDMKDQRTGWKPLSGGGPGGSRDTKVHPNVQEPNRDGRVDMWLTEGGFVWGLPRAGGVIRGVTS